MNPTEYTKNALRSESNPNTFNSGIHFLSDGKIRLLHATMGLCTESGELTDQLKKHLFYGKSLDRINLIEEAGDLMWYLAILLDELGSSFEEVMHSNIAKLRRRYPGKFTESDAIERDIEGERKTLEMNIETKMPKTPDRWYLHKISQEISGFEDRDEVELLKTLVRVKRIIMEWRDEADNKEIPRGAPCVPREVNKV